MPDVENNPMIIFLSSMESLGQITNQLASVQTMLGRPHNHKGYGTAKYRIVGFGVVFDAEHVIVGFAQKSLFLTHIRYILILLRHTSFSGESACLIAFSISIDRMAKSAR